MNYQMRMTYWQFVETEAKAIGSDGCTGVSEWHKECCWEHDLCCHFGKDPRDAYRLYCEDHRYPREAIWQLTDDMSRRQADYAFAKCNLEWSPTRKGKLRSIGRFLGVRIGAFLGIGVRTPKVDHDTKSA